MTKEDIEKIVEKTVEWLNGYAFTDSDNGAHIPTLIHDFLKDSRVYFDELVQPSLPSNVDEVAQKVEDYYDVGEEHGYLCCHRGDIKNTFKAGAEWQLNEDAKKFYFIKLKDIKDAWQELKKSNPEIKNKPAVCFYRGAVWKAGGEKIIKSGTVDELCYSNLSELLDRDDLSADDEIELFFRKK